jgi:hypothetical protein
VVLIDIPPHFLILVTSASRCKGCHQLTFLQSKPEFSHTSYAETRGVGRYKLL